jgi:fructose/tagatose bisphosphate aldolase
MSLFHRCDDKKDYGVPIEEIVEGMKYGLRKVNIDTNLDLVWRPPAQCVA